MTTASGHALDGAAPLPGAPAGVVPRPALSRSEFERLARRARMLSWLSLVWMGAEGTIAILAGVVAGSIALVGFGIDSAIAQSRGSRVW